LKQILQPLLGSLVDLLLGDLLAIDQEIVPRKVWRPFFFLLL